MVYLAKELIQVAPFSKNTFYRRVSELKKKKEVKTHGNFYNESEAEKIAAALGFLDEFKKLVEQKKKVNDNN